MSKTKEKQDLTIFFTEILNGIKNVKCQECGKTIYNPGRECIAHVLPKSIFKSVATNKHNFMYLCLSDHAMYDSSWKKAKTMHCWAAAKRQYDLFKDDVLEVHKNLLEFQ